MTEHTKTCHWAEFIFLSLNLQVEKIQLHSRVTLVTHVHRVNRKEKK
jgi:hypothetical protein